jgi:hypothetical protein
MMVKAGRSPAGWTRLAAMVARSASKVAKLCAGPPLGVALVAALAAAAGERRAGATGLGRAARPTAGSSSLNSIDAWLQTIAVRGRPAPASALHARLQAAPSGPDGADGTAQAVATAALTATLTALSAQIKALETQIAGQLAAHPDGHLFTSLARAGTVRAARLLAETGDCRSRFPDPESLAGRAGGAPVTRRSGTRISHSFRWAVKPPAPRRRLRLRRRLPARQPVGSGHLRRGPRPGQGPPARRPHHARAWIYVIWRCWQDSVAYDPAKHNALQNILARQQAGGAADTR